MSRPGEVNGPGRLTPKHMVIEADGCKQRRGCAQTAGFGAGNLPRKLHAGGPPAKRKPRLCGTSACQLCASLRAPVKWQGSASSLDRACAE